MAQGLKKRYSIKLFANIISGIIGAILIAIVPKALGPIAYGQFIYLQDFFMKIIGFLDMGSSIAFFTKLSAKQTRKELISFYFIYSFIVLALLLFVIFMIKYFDYTSYLLPNIPKEYIFMGLFFGFFTWFTQIFIKISDAYALTVSVELIKIGHKIISLLLLLFFIYRLDFNLEKYFYFHYIALIAFLSILIWLFIQKEILTNLKFKILNFKLITKEFIDYCHPLLVYSIMGIVVGLFDIWLLQKIAGSEQTGFYGLAYSLAAMCFIFTGAMTPIITREFAKSFAEKNIKEMRVLFFKYIPIFYAIATYFSVFIAFQSENLLVIFTNHEFHDAYLVLMIMAYYPIHQTYGQLSGSIFYVTEQTKLIRNIGIISSILGFILTILFLYIFDLQAIGLAFKMVIIQIISVNIQLYFNSKFLDFKISYFIKHQIFSLLFFMLIAYITDFIVFPFSNKLIEFLVSGLIYTVFVLIGVIIAPTIFGLSKEEILSIKNYLKKIRIK